MIQTTEGWDAELNYIDSMIAEDLRNNSAWNQRYFAITRCRTIPISNDVRQRELNYAFEWIKKAPNNQSPWTYIKG